MRLCSASLTLFMPRFVSPTDPAPDMILEAPDCVRFAAHSARLAARSQVFRDMLELSLPSAEPVKLTESAAVIDSLLAIIYGEHRPDAVDPGSFKLAFELYLAAHKYQLDRRATRLCAKLIWCE